MKVTLVGAGPGDGGLITLKGALRLKNADVVLYDRFVGEEILAMIPPAAEKIDVGKTAGSHPVPQDEINRMLLEKAVQGLNVVRLKGGDPFLFGRGGEELELLVQNDIPFEVVPGVTSAIAGAAYAGIPVTHRDCASSLHIITGHGKHGTKPDIDYGALVRAGGTLVFLMGVAAAGDICAGLIACGMDRDMPAAIVENAATNVQRKLLGTVGTLTAIASENAVVSPSLIIVGKVCLFSERYDWFAKMPLRGKRVIVARTGTGASKLSGRLRELGCHVNELPCAEIIPITNPGCALEKSLENIAAYSWLVFTSGTGVNVFFDYLIHTGFDIRKLCHIKIACVGAETEKEVNKRGIIPQYRPAEYNGAALVRGLSALADSGDRLLIARAKDGAGELTQILAQSGIPFDDVTIYQKTPVRKDAQSKITTETDADFVAFTSSSAVEGFARAASGMDFGKVKAVCIGEKTAATAKAYGMEVCISEEATIDSMVSLVERLCG